MCIMTPEISQLAGSPKAQKFKYLENETVLSLQMKKKSLSAYEKL